MSVERLQPADDGSGNLELVDSIWVDSSGTDYANAVVPLPAGALPGIDPASASAANRAACDALISDITLALGGNGDLASSLVADLEYRVDQSLGVSS